MYICQNHNGNLTYTKFSQSYQRLHAYLYCPGPSLANVDPERINVPGTVKMAINTAYPKIRPDIWMGMDTPECYDPNLFFEPFPKLLRQGFSDISEKKLDTFPGVYHIPVQETKEILNMFVPKLSGFAWFNHTLGVALHFLIWSGVKQIHLVGCDQGGPKDYYDDRTLPDHLRLANRALYNKQIVFLKKVAALGKQFNVDIISCTPGSPINEFLEYKDLYTALRESNKKVVTLNNKDVLHVRQVLFKDKVKDINVGWKRILKDRDFGILIGMDSDQEWMLEWWFDNYKKFNKMPVALVNYGMTRDGLEKAKKLADYIIQFPKLDIHSWFKKPFALKRSPFQNTVWIDIDCQVRHDLGPLRKWCRNYGFAVAPDKENKFSQTTFPVNSGVIAYKHKNKIIDLWAESTIKKGDQYRSDQEVLEVLLHEEGADYGLIPPLFNWMRLRGVNRFAHIIHWTGEEGKKEIRKQIKIPVDNGHKHS